MSSQDQNNPLSSLQSFIFGAQPAAGVPTYAQLQMRRKIAESLLGRRSPYPKTFGEGLSAIGEAIGDRGMMNKIDEMEQAREAQIGPEYNKQMGIPPAAPAAVPASRSYAPDDTITSPPPPSMPPLPPAPGNLPPTGEPGNTGADTFAPPLQTTPAQRDPLPPDQQQSYAPDAPVRMMTPDQLRNWRLQNPLPPGVAPPPGAGSQSSIVPPGLNQSVALNQTAPAEPVGPPTAFSGQPTSDAPPIGMPLTGQPPPATDARAAIADSLTPKPPPVVAPPVPPPPGPQIAQAPPQPQIRVPQKELKPPDVPEQTQQMKDLLVFSSKLGPDDPRLPSLKQRYQDLDAANQAKYKQKQDEYIYQRERRDKAPQEAATLERTRQEISRGQQELISTGESSGQATPLGAAVLAGPDPRLGTDRSPQRTGIPRSEPVPPGVIPAEWAKDQAKKLSATQDALETTKPQLSEALSLIDKIRTHPGKDRSIGPLGGIGQSTPQGQGFIALDEQLKGKNLVEAYKIIKGTGQIGEKEGQNIAKSLASLTTKATKEDYDTALNTLETTMRGTVERLERKANRPVTAYQRTPDDPYAPDIGQRSKSGNFEYVGGDPQDKHNWKRVK